MPETKSTRIGTRRRGEHGGGAANCAERVNELEDDALRRLRLGRRLKDLREAA
jgi:hypothetical protein